MVMCPHGGSQSAPAARGAMCNRRAICVCVRARARVRARRVGAGVAPGGCFLLLGVGLDQAYLNEALMEILM